MAIENFSRKIMGSGVFHIYIAAGFFGTLIFFVLNSNLFTPLEMTFGTIIVTIALKSISNLMFSLIVLLFDLKHTHEEHDFKMAEDRLNILLNQMNVAEASAQASKIVNEQQK